MFGDILGYIISWRFLLILLAMFLLLANDYRAYHKDKHSNERAAEVSKNQKDMKESLTLIAKTLAIVTGKWETIDLSKGAPPVISNAVFLLFKSENGLVKGYVKGSGYDEQHPFDTSINNSIPVGIEVKEPKAEYIITYPKDRKIKLSIFVAGYRINR